MKIFILSGNFELEIEKDQTIADLKNKIAAHPDAPGPAEAYGRLITSNGKTLARKK